MRAVQLHNMTAYSLLSSTNRVPDFVARAKELGYQALGITDINVMSGVIEFYQECTKQGIKPVIGLTIDYKEASLENETCQLTLYAQNEAAYHQLIELSTKKMLEGHLELVDIIENSGLLTLVIPVEQSEVSYYLGKDNFEKTEAFIKKLKVNKRLFGGISTQIDEGFRQKLIDIYQEHQIPIVAHDLVKYQQPSDHFSVELLKHIEAGTKIEDVAQQQTGPYYLSEAKEIEKYYAALELQDAYQNALKIVEETNFELNFSETLLPKFKTPNQESAENYLKQLCFNYLPLRVPNYTDSYVKRLEKELAVIHKMGFDDYFLIVWDVMRFAQEHHIVTGAGRGSAAGALVSYVLSITDVDPIKYDLLFERFLNIERNSMPDIDLDIPDNRREEVLQYVNETYGHNHVAQIATFGTMAAKMVLRDVCRVFGLSQSEASQWSNAIPNVLKITLSQAYNDSKKLQQLVGQSERNQLIFDVASRLEGLPRHVSTHAAGVVISDQYLTQVVPLQLGTNDIPLTQFTMKDVEAVGLLKMDFLGLRNLSIIDDTLHYIRKMTGETLNQKEIPREDEATLELFRRGQTMGVFQFESAGIRNVLRKVKPNSIEDIAAVNALYRPGPMQNIDLFVKRKNGESAITYPHESLKEILDVTYGIIVYQEQIMQVASKMAGFTLGQADILQRAISKKVKSTIEAQKIAFIEGSITNGYSEETASEVYQYIEKFANYGFNRSHAMAYSFVGYQMAYLKVHYPAAFFAALLHSVRHNLTKIKEYIADAKMYHLKIKGPNINQSYYSFTLTHQNELLFGFSSLKGIRRDFIQEIIEERKLNGAYRSMDNFLLRMDNRWLKPDLILPLIQIGAFDDIEPNRRKLVVELEGNIQNILLSGGSVDLLGILSLKEQEIEDFTLDEKLLYEEELLGTYVSGHPVSQFESIRLIKNVKAINQGELKQTINLLVHIKKVRQIRTKRGEQMAFLEGSDETSNISITLFPTIYRKVYGDIKENAVYFVRGKLEQSQYNQELQLLAEEIIPIQKLMKQIGKQIGYLKISSEKDVTSSLKALENLLEEFPGNTPIIIFDEQTKKKMILSESKWVTVSQELTEKLMNLLGDECVVFK